MLAVRALRPLSQAPRLARPRLNSSAAARPVHPEPASHGKTLLIIGASTAAAVAGVTAALEMRGSHGHGAEVKDAAGKAVSAAQDKVEDFKSAATEKANDAVNKAKAAGADVQAKVSDATDSARSTADDAAAKVQGAAASAKSKADGVVATAKGKVQDATASAKDKAHDAKEAALEKMRKAAEPLVGLPGADSVIADLMAQAERALEGWAPSKK